MKWGNKKKKKEIIAPPRKYSLSENAAFYLITRVIDAGLKKMKLEMNDIVYKKVKHGNWVITIKKDNKDAKKD